jgi:hypothetical protein
MQGVVNSKQFFNFFCAVAIILPIYPANASWQYTRWGMTKDEVIAASRGSAHTPSKVDSYYKDTFVHLLDTTYEAQNIYFKVHFLFNQKHRLSRVKLVPTNPDRCPSLEELLSDAYGRAYLNDVNSAGKTVKWRDKKNNNIVMFVNIPLISQCSVSYDSDTPGGEAGGL